MYIVLQVFNLTVKLYHHQTHPSKIGIISPYKLQVQNINKKFEDNKLKAPKIGSVEEFQGQERDIIMLSTVRSCPENIQRQVSGSEH